MKGIGVSEDQADGDKADLDALARLAKHCERVFELPSTHAPGVFFVGAEISARAFGLDDYGLEVVSLSGKGLTGDTAFRRCMGEGAEWLSTLVWGDEPTTEVSLGDGLAGFSADTRDWIVHHLAAEEGDSQVPTRWLPARRLDRDEFIQLPESLCLRLPGNRGSESTAPVTTSGCAAAPTLQLAILRGLLELVERDAAALWWYGGRRPGALDTASRTAGQTFVARLRVGSSSDRSMQFLDLTTDIALPVIAAVSSAPDGTAVACGLAAGLDLGSAIREAALEACQMELAQSLVVLKRDQRGIDGLNDGDRRILRRMTELNAKAEPLFSPDRNGDRRHANIKVAPCDALVRCAERLASCGHATYAVDLTRKCLAIPAARAIVPGLQALPIATVTPRLAKAIDDANVMVADIHNRIPLL